MEGSGAGAGEGGDRGGRKVVGGSSAGVWADGVRKGGGVSC